MTLPIPLDVILFYALSALAIAAAAMVVLARNQIHAVLFLILCFFAASGLFLLQGAEFLAMVLLIVYVGAVAVLFLFAIMLLGKDVQPPRKSGLVLPLAGIMGAAGLAAMSAAVVWDRAIGCSPCKMNKALAARAAETVMRPDEANVLQIGRLLYTEYAFPFLIVGVILLVAMVGAIMLAMGEKGRSKRQDMAAQVAVRAADCVEVVKVTPGKGI